MNETTLNSKPYTEHDKHDHLLCWKSLLAGLFISFMFFMLFSALGAGFVGVAAQSAVENESGGSALLTGSGLWLGLTLAISLFLGSFFAVRLADRHNKKVGIAHGLVIASLFFTIMISGLGSAVGSLSNGLGSMVKSIGEGSGDLMSNATLQDVVNRALPTEKIRSEPKAFAQGLAVRLAQGDVESAKAYYSYETGLSGAEVDAKINQLKNDFEAAAKTVADKAAKAVSAIGWTLFIVFLLGMIAAGLGGEVASESNLKMTLRTNGSRVVGSAHRPVLNNQNGSAFPYILGWLLGVPTTILFLIFILRAIF